MKTIQTTGTLTVSAGSANPPASNEAASSSDVSMVQFDLAASTVEDVMVTAVALRASGTGDDATGVARV